MKTTPCEISPLIKKKFNQTQRPTDKLMEKSKAVAVAPKASPKSTKKMGG